MTSKMGLLLIVIAPISAFVDAKAVAQQARSPVAAANIEIARVTRNATDGVLSLEGSLKGFVLNRSFAAPLKGTIIPNSQAGPVLSLSVEPVQLDVLGLKVDTGTICLSTSARMGKGLQGHLVCLGLKNVLAAAKRSPDKAKTLLNKQFDNPQLKGMAGQILSQSQVRLVSLMLNRSPKIKLGLTPVSMNVSGVAVRFDNGASGPIEASIAAPKGWVGNLLAAKQNKDKDSGLLNVADAGGE